jgi:hypothetical protein
LNALLISLAVLLIVMGGATVGSFLGRILPPHHLDDASKDIVKFGAGIIATLAALVLGLSVASAKSSYDAKADEIEQSAAKIILLDQLLRQYGSEAKPAREMLRAVLVSRHSMTWVDRESRGTAAGVTETTATASANAIRVSIAALVPASDAQRSLHTRSLQIIDEFMQTRWLFIAQSTARISIPLLIVVVIWLATIGFCTGLYAPRNGTVTAVGLLCALSISAAVFLIVEMYQPFDGIMRISDAPLRTAIGYLEH